ncbi:hypothetical protein PsalN5692_00398 [Piscirickettsia salmonis]|uniref:DUF4286 family protein n=1 Tax=Piscirickettsia salmonis TaxID=1238 RepID=UPI0012B9408E|nr:DUF4286 family protein [Piscirickettsia salmonis]QGP48983.1 hypothetical protein PsalN5692_00398 [Piscirickettsia salmonis]QGP56271.1 hypothetical protein PsalSR1_03748 [Piscirickettsia salmonis]QGP57857.1 hypothetical protein PsalBI1_00403 [Piscirickettsia salmonis]QGP65840.1 hypothetical protein PsalMR5_03753 [Piscirickettsia salmonis]
MVIYQVNLNIDANIFNEYKAWLIPHMQEMLSFPGFLQADLCDDIETDININNEIPTQNLTALYLLDSEQSLQYYFDHCAKPMRDDGIKKFGNHFRATRNILKISQSFTRKSLNIR